ncbi:MAG TPA: universal stress protein [Jatrophihabitans sp.]|nr:universal stress protein [Jatrophihabitans sp.]
MTGHSGLPVIAGVDGTIRSVEAARWAAREAARRGVGLTIVHASYLNYPPEARYSPDAPGEVVERSGADAALAEAYEAAIQAEPGLSVTVAAHHEKPAHYLLTESRSASMIVLGTHPGNSLTGALLGSLSQTVAAHAMCPVVLVGGAGPDEAGQPATGPVVVGVSPKPGGREALHFAFVEAQLRGTPLTAVRSWGDVDWGAGRLGYGSELFAEWRRMEANVLHTCLAEFAEQFPAVEVRRELPGKRASLALQQAAAGAQLLVVGCHRQDDHWFSRLGSVPSWLLHRSPCPLAIVGQPHALPADRPEPVRSPATSPAAPDGTPVRA